jgi:TolB protein
LVAASLALAASACGTGTPVKTEAPRILFASSRTGAWALYSMRPDGRDQRRFADNLGGINPGAEGDGIGVPALTPDGLDVLVPRKGTTALTLATGAARHLATGQPGGIWSPDGRRFASMGPGWDNAPIYVSNREGSHQRALPGTKNGVPNAWSPDGKWILFSRQDGYGPYYLWRIHPNGTGLRQLTIYSAASDVLWLPDGRAEYVANHAVNVTNFEPLVALDIHSGKADVLRRIPSPDSVAWSPDGTTLAYAAGENGQRPEAIYTVSAAGGNLRRLTPPGKEQYDQRPAWSPDGKTIAFVRETDGGAEEYTQEIWTMRADGSHQRQLTHAYPDEGENIEPVWISGPVATTPPPHVVAVGRTLHVPYLVSGITAEGARAAIAPFGYDSAGDGQPAPPLLVWRPGSQPESLVGALCGTITPAFLTEAQLTIACDHNFLDEHRQAILVFDLHTRVPSQPISAYNSFFGPGTQAGTIVDGPVLSGGRVEYETSHWVLKAKTRSFDTTKLPRQILWAADGSHKTMLRTAHRLGTLLAGDRDWLAFTVPGGVEITSPSGRPVRLLRLPALHFSQAPTPGFLLAGNELIRLGGGKLESWDVRDGRMLANRNVPQSAQLQAADGRYIAYTARSDLHLVTRTGDRVIHTPAASSHWTGYYGDRPLHAALSPAGLFYAYDLKSGGFPGRVVFVPRSALPR